MRITCREKMESSMLCSGSSPSLPPLPEKRIVLGFGGLVIDVLATVAAFPKPDDKIRSTNTKVQGGGNVGNTLTAAARLGLTSRMISKVANDSYGRILLAELKADNVDTSYIVVSEGNTAFSYIIVDEQAKTRTCIHTVGAFPMVPDDLSPSSLSSSLNGARLVYSDGRLRATALVILKEAMHRNIPILINVEKPREGLDDILNLADYVVCSAKFPQAWSTAPSVSSALLSMLLRLPRIKFVIVTLGELGCIMLERSLHEGPELEEVDIDTLLESLKRRLDGSDPIPSCVSHESIVKLTARGLGSTSGRLFVGSAELIPPQEIVDTTGAGDAFVGAILYGICAGMPTEKMLPFAAKVAGASCRALGARTGLPRREDPCLAPFLL